MEHCVNHPDLNAIEHCEVCQRPLCGGTAPSRPRSSSGRRGTPTAQSRYTTSFSLRLEHRPSHDRVGRFGGEEFLLLLPDTALAQSAPVMARIKRELAARPLLEGDTDIKLTFSAGVAQRHPRESLDAVVARADAALYQAKHAGKNRTTLAR